MDDPATPLPRQDGRFKPGQSGNPGGRKPGERNRVSLLAEKLMADDAEEVVRAVITAAKGGDPTAMKLVLDRIAPPSKSRPITFTMPPIGTAADVAAAMQALLNATGSGELTPDEGATVAGILELRRKALETAELEERIAQLEQDREAGR